MAIVSGIREARTDLTRIKGRTAVDVWMSHLQRMVRWARIAKQSGADILRRQLRRQRAPVAPSIDAPADEPAGPEAPPAGPEAPPAGPEAPQEPAQEVPDPERIKTLAACTMFTSVCEAAVINALLARSLAVPFNLAPGATAAQSTSEAVALWAIAIVSQFFLVQITVAVVGQARVSHCW